MSIIDRDKNNNNEFISKVLDNSFKHNEKYIEQKIEELDVIERQEVYKIIEKALDPNIEAIDRNPGDSTVQGKFTPDGDYTIYNNLEYIEKIEYCTDFMPPVSYTIILLYPKNGNDENIRVKSISHRLIHANQDEEEDTSRDLIYIEYNEKESIVYAKLNVNGEILTHNMGNSN